ncbi:Zn-dependent oxidoreductase, NADPH:quinone reductase [Frankia torreyi]|uniref:Zn-dependent oxidoreductase, NADPH:quinone reductase n=2 Tax=Frankia TaxID=1854 RepID=A0A0D8BB50_9ACTN|nr:MULTISPECIES: NADP-dependent oxidoreductase [Frankia]KJE21406.1 Zn-dependent oxidoreductase, NADPH:quinone reductase [Frankia torreyi]
MSVKIYFEEYGSPTVLVQAEETVGEPGAGEVRIVNRAISVNPVDWKVVAGYLKDFVPLQLPAVPGNETAGVVDAVGSGVDGFAVGDEVIWSGFTGGYRAQANVPASSLIAKPAAVDFEQAASLPVAAGTAYSAVHQVGVREGDTVLVHAAAGGVGTATVQIAKALGARVIGTASPANHDYLRSIGAEPVTYGDGLVDAVKALGTISASIDNVGGAASVAATVALLPDLSRAVTAVADEHAAAAGIAAVAASEDRLAAVVKLAEQGVVRFEIQDRFPLAEAAKAFELSLTGHVRGKIILVP